MTARQNNKALQTATETGLSGSAWLANLENYTEEDMDRGAELQLRDSAPDGTTIALLARQLMNEHGCRTASEKAVARVAANAYTRIMENSRVLADLVRHESATQLYINLYATVSKELDRATRQFDTSISTLLRMKSPAMKVNVVAKTAFVANNQQINADPKEL